MGFSWPDGLKFFHTFFPLKAAHIFTQSPLGVRIIIVLPSLQHILSLEFLRRFRLMISIISACHKARRVYFESLHFAMLGADFINFSTEN